MMKKITALLLLLSARALLAVCLLRFLSQSDSGCFYHLSFPFFTPQHIDVLPIFRALTISKNRKCFAYLKYISSCIFHHSDSTADIFQANTFSIKSQTEINDLNKIFNISEIAPFFESKCFINVHITA